MVKLYGIFTMQGHVRKVKYWKFVNNNDFQKIY